MATVKQLSYAPTNKLTAAMLAGLAYEFLQPVIVAGVEGLGSAIGIAWTLGANGDMLLQFLLMLLVGYFIKDAPNTAPPETSA